MGSIILMKLKINQVNCHYLLVKSNFAVYYTVYIYYAVFNTKNMLLTSHRLTDD